MFNSVKEKLYSAVQDSLENSNVLKKITEVQKSKKNHVSISEEHPIGSVNYNAGAEILTKYQTEWKELHENAEQNARLAESIDSEMTKIHTSVNEQLDNIVAINSALARLPQLTMAVEQCILKIKVLNAAAQLVENDLIELEDLIEESDFRRRQNEHTFQLTMYKEKKFAEFEKSRILMAKQKASAAREMEIQQRNTLQQRQNAAHAAFLKDLDRFKSKGELPKTEESEADANSTPALEDIQLSAEDASELDDFLNK